MRLGPLIRSLHLPAPDLPALEAFLLLFDEGGLMGLLSSQETIVAGGDISFSVADPDAVGVQR
jgi:hypothetical protein